MTQLLPNIFAIEVPEDADPDEWEIFDVDGKSYLNGLTEDGTMYAGTSPLPGSYEILFATKDCTEEQVKSIVDYHEDSDTWDCGTQYSHTEYWTDYYNYENGDLEYRTATESLQSLLRSKNLDPN